MSDRIEIIKELRALEKFCAFPASLVGEERERFMKDYLADVESYALDAIKAACAEWRRSGSTKFPTSGQLLPLIRKHEPNKADAVSGPWRPATPEEYSPMTIREKIREQLILSQEAFRKAGPMFRNTTTDPSKPSGVHLRPEDMPSTWHHWTQVGRQHAHEAKRLRDVISIPR